MPDPRQLPYLLSLLDDDSVDVQEAVVRELTSYGADLEQYLTSLPPDIREGHRILLDQIVREGRRRRLRESWAGLTAIAGEAPLLEEGLRLVSEFLQAPALQGSLAAALDDYAARFREAEGPHDALALADFLFQRERLLGARESYYSAQNSNLLYVLTEKSGLPITLTCAYVLIGDRCGLKITGCNLPGHFLAIAPHHGRKFVVDCYNGGIVLLDTDLARLSPAAHMTTSDLLGLECTSRVILSRVMRNLAHAYRRREDSEAMKDAELIEALIAMRSTEEEM
jgi:hypothetical protein